MLIIDHQLPAREKRSLALFPEMPLGSGIAYIFLCAPVQNTCLLAFTETGGIKYRAILKHASIWLSFDFKR